ncbi:MAG: lyase family protein [Planctomycetota bacterium]|jgi:adenylosuccinate lyase
MTMFDAVCPIDGRYVGAETETFREVWPYLSTQAEIRYQLRVECAILRAYGELGLLPLSDLTSLENLEDKITTEEVYFEEEITQHNIRALVNCIQRRLPDSLKPFVHLGPTSADITDTARALQIRDFFNEVLLHRLIAFERQLIGLSEENAGTPQVGRTHGQHAIPTTFGHAMALYVSRLGNRILALEHAALNLIGKLSGAVGAYNTFSVLFPEDPQEIERRVMQQLGLRSSPTGIASQIVEPEPITDLACAVVSGFSVLANLADDLRNLMRTEIGEIGKVTHKGHVGSSTMPHKVNPKDYENVKSLWKAFMPRVLTLFADQISEHQRDLTNSASGRFLHELIAGFYYGVVRMQRAVKSLRVNREAMARNLDHSKETFIAEPLYIVSGMSGIPDAYEVMKALSERARAKGITLSGVVEEEGWPKALSEGLRPEIMENLEAIRKDPGSYSGIAERVALETCGFWAKQILAVEKKLPRFPDLDGEGEG